MCGAAPSVTAAAGTRPPRSASRTRIRDERVPCIPGHRDVAHQNVRMVPTEPLRCFGRRCGRGDARAVQLEGREQRRPHVGIFLDEQDTHARQDRSGPTRRGPGVHDGPVERERIWAVAERQRDGERRSLPRTRALGVDRSVMQLDDLADDREPETEAPMGPRARVVLPVALEEVWQEVRRDSLTHVPHRDHCVRALAHYTQQD